MKRFRILTVAYLSLLALVVPLRATEKNSASNAASSSAKPGTVNELYPGLTTGALTCAISSELPKGVLLKAGELVIGENELSEEIVKAPEQLQPKLTKNAIFVLEQLATLKLLLAEAKAEAAKTGTDISEKDEQEIIQEDLHALAGTAKVGDADIQDFYNDNKEMFGGASLAQVRPQIEQFLLQHRQQELVDERIRTIGERVDIRLSSSWLKEQAVLARDNPVDRARASGMASLVDFGSTGCRPCDMMAPVLASLKERYEGRLNVLFIHVGEEQILAVRYGVQAIPVQVLFDKAGKEVFRHVGFLPMDQIEKQLSELGVN